MMYEFKTSKQPEAVIEMPEWGKPYVTENAVKLCLKEQFEGKPMGDPVAIDKGGLYETSEMAIRDVFVYFVNKDAEKVAVVYSWRNGEAYLFRLCGEGKEFDQDQDYDRFFLPHSSEEQMHESFMSRAQKMDTRKKREKHGDKLVFRRVVVPTRFEDLKIREKALRWDGFYGRY